MTGTMVRKDANVSAEPAGPRRLRFTISTPHEDSEHDRIFVRGWDLTQYDNVVLWGHDARLPAIARAMDTRVVGEALKSTAEFPPAGLYPLADQVYELMKAGFLSGKASVGFLAGEWRHNDVGGIDFVQGHQLLEWSVVNLPANRQATLDAAHRGVDRAAVQKWLRGGRAGLPPGFASLADFLARTVPVASPNADEDLITIDLDKLREEDTMTRAQWGAYFNDAQDAHHARLAAMSQTDAQRERLAASIAMNALTRRDEWHRLHAPAGEPELPFSRAEVHMAMREAVVDAVEQAVGARFRRVTGRLE